MRNQEKPRKPRHPLIYANLFRLWLKIFQLWNVAGSRFTAYPLCLTWILMVHFENLWNLFQFTDSSDSLFLWLSVLWLTLFAAGFGSRFVLEFLERIDPLTSLPQLFFPINLVLRIFGKALNQQMLAVFGAYIKMNKYIQVYILYNKNQ